MLSELSIRGFRGIRTMSMGDCGKVNLIVGRNDSGKTTVLEAIRLLLTGDPRHLRRLPQNRYDRVRTNPESSFLLAFYNRLETSEIEISGTLGGKNLKATAKILEILEGEQIQLDLDEAVEEDEESLLEPGKQVEVKVSAEEGSVKLSLPFFGFVSPSGARRGIVHPSGQRSLTGEFPKLSSPVWLGTNRLESFSLARRYSQVYRSGGADALIKVLASIEPTIEELVVLTESREQSTSGFSGAVLEVKLTGKQSFPLETMGEGFTSIISIVTAVATAENGLCLLDEIENGIHYSILSQVWSSTVATAIAYDSQVWVTTHSLDCISAAYEAFSSYPDLLRVHRMDRREDGEIRVHTFDHDMLGRALERGLEVR